jgi:protein-export membrane protein SecD
MGFSWTTLFFGPFPALLRGDVKWFFIMALLALCTLTLSNYIFCFIYNKIYIRSLLENGYVAADDSVRTFLQAKGILFSGQSPSTNNPPTVPSEVGSAPINQSSPISPSGFEKKPSFSSSDNMQYVKKPVSIGIIIGLVAVVLILLIVLGTIVIRNINPQTVMKHKGGVKIVLKIDNSNISNEQLDQECAVIKRRIDGLGISNPSIQKQGNDRIVVKLPGFHDPDVAARIIGSTARLEFHLLREPAELDKAIKTIDAELVAKPGQSASKFSDLLVGIGEQIGTLESNKAEVEAILMRQDMQNALSRVGLGGSNFLWSHETRVANNLVYRMLFYVKSSPEMCGDVIKDTRGAIDRDSSATGSAIVELEMNDKGTKTFALVTGANVGYYLAIVIDSAVYSAPVIRARIPSGRAQIEGNFTIEDAKNLAMVLRAGALPIPVLLMELRVIRPGKEEPE